MSQPSCVTSRRHSSGSRRTPFPVLKSCWLSSNIQRALLDAPTGENAVTSIVVDEYERIAGSASAERVIELLHESQRFKLVVASRVRPAWATARRFMYDELIEVGADQLALTEDEIADVMGAATATQDVFEQARG